VSAPSLLAISARTTLPAALSLPRWVESLAAAGVPALQLREKDLPDRALVDLVRALRPRFPGLLLVNGRADAAIAGGADGVHLPADGVPTAALRRRFGDSFCIGRSTHTLDEVRRAAGEGADFVVFGPVFATPGKGAPVGLDELARAAEIGLPVLALGGVEVENLASIVAAGAAGVAGIRLFQDVARLDAVVHAARAARRAVEARS